MSSIHVSSLCASLGAASHISGPPSGRPRRIQYQHRPPSTRTPGRPITNEAIAPLSATPRSGVAITCRLAIVQRRHVPPAAVSTRGTWHVARAAGLWRILGGWLPTPGTIPPRPSRYRPVLLPPPPPAGPGQDQARLSAAEFYWHSPQIAGLVWSREAASTPAERNGIWRAPGPSPGASEVPRGRGQDAVIWLFKDRNVE